jgi:hypothetical protein
MGTLNSSLSVPIEGVDGSPAQREGAGERGILWQELALSA